LRHGKNWALTPKIPWRLTLFAILKLVVLGPKLTFTTKNLRGLLLSILSYRTIQFSKNHHQTIPPNPNSQAKQSSKNHRSSKRASNPQTGITNPKTNQLTKTIPTPLTTCSKSLRILTAQLKQSCFNH
jgi:hypothetical protein